jgi:hypothetical protein
MLYAALSSAHRLIACVAISFASACLAAPLGSQKAGLPDGAECEHAEECKSGGCNHNRLCAHSSCDCPGDTCTPGGEVSKDCQQGWLCVYYKSLFNGAASVFGIEGDLNGGTCQVPCVPACPEHYFCTGQFCGADPYWANPVPSVSWSGAAEGTLSGNGQTAQVMLEQGKTVSLTASAVSPVEAALSSFAWTIVDSSGERVMSDGMQVDVTLDSSSFKRAELQVLDADTRAAQISVVYETCLGTGGACGYQGSGCCSACDADRKFCL